MEIGSIDDDKAGEHDTLPKIVTPENFRLELNRTEASEVPLIEKLAAEFRQEAAKAIGWVAVESGRRGSRQGAARMVLAEVAETGWRNLATGLVDEANAVSGWHLKALASCVSGMERAVVTGLRRTLGDRRAVPIPPGGEWLEEPVPELRICDLAYLGLRRNLAVETELAGVTAAAVFSALPEGERNSEIMRYAETGQFSNFGVDGPEGEE